MYYVPAQELLTSCHKNNNLCKNDYNSVHLLSVLLEYNTAKYLAVYIKTVLNPSLAACHKGYICQYVIPAPLWS